MLILTRKPGESLYIGDNIKVTLVEIKGSQGRLGIDAPAEIRIYREEIYLQILEENKQAAEAAMGTASDLDALSGWVKKGDSSSKGASPKVNAWTSLSSSRVGGSKGGPDVVIKKKRSKKTDE